MFGSSRDSRPLRRRLRPGLFLVCSVLVGIEVLIAALNFPFDVDAAPTEAQLAASRKYYAEAYRAPASKQDSKASESETRYLRMAKATADYYHIEDQIRDFVNRFELRTRPVVEVGSGGGYLQDVAEDYTGLDISTEVSRYYHKRFVLGSATAMPFPDNSFDGLWSIWVLEHVVGPEQALREIRRVVRNGGVIFLLPAWNCNGWAAQGYSVRPCADFNMWGKVVKASLTVRASDPYRAASRVPNRLLRTLAASFGGPTTLHYCRLTPNYETYWQPDGDAVNSLDRHEVALWFRSRGDECLNYPISARAVFLRNGPLIVRVHKQQGER